MSSIHPGYGSTHIPSTQTSGLSALDGERRTEGPGRLRRGLSARQVQMIAIAGTIGTGLFLGTGRSLAQGGPASVLICYSLVGFIVYVTLLLLGEMATQYPVADGGTESLGITAGETCNPTRNMPRVVKFVFWRILIFYVLSIFLIGLNVPYDYPDLSNRSTTTSPFTIVFYLAGSNTAASIMNTVILSSVLSAGNHALFAGTRVLYSLSSSTPPLGPLIFARTDARGVPLPALFATGSISALCFASSFVGSGVLWGWLQNIVGVSNQIAWLSIGIASWRFRKAWLSQGRPLEELKFRAAWTWPWGPHFVVRNGWSSMIPTFSAVDFASFYVEIPVMLSMYTLWIFWGSSEFSLIPPNPSNSTSGEANTNTDQSVNTPLLRPSTTHRRWRTDLVDVHTLDLYADEHTDGVEEHQDDDLRASRLKSRYATFWRLWDIVA
ncbi:hypothetical protein BD410DRAFT_795911 [Rickenella mellea]|uniref:Amino acid permease/ SLC12A domain-containing protein n=1 Tax=Rickenella mellea TaxID=50990 RepID=A0A4Y7PL16_9AGAM|nr:hypothetical protein BD410DRAFT_795911 [Rickenella mellea]